MHFRQNLRKFYEIRIFDLEGIDLGSPKLHVSETFDQSTFHKNLMILAIIGAELSGVGQILPPLPWRIILDPIPARGLKRPKMWPICDIRHILKHEFLFPIRFFFLNDQNFPGNSAFCLMPAAILCT